MMEQATYRPAPTLPVRGDASGGAGGPHGYPRAALEAMVDALRSETRLLEDLTAIMQRQREAVGADDLAGLDDSVFATHRLLVTLAEARRRRRAVNRLLGAPEEMNAHQLETLLGPSMTPALAEARDGLHAVAARLAAEVDVNRRVLAEAMASSDSYVRTLYGTGGAAPATAPNGGGRLLNLTA